MRGRIARRFGVSWEAMRKLHAILLASIFASACAGAPPAKSEGATAEGTAKAEAPQSPAEKCLAIAGAKIERKADEPAKIGVRHVVVKYKGAKNSPDSITRSREEACLRAMEARDKIQAGTDFDAIVNEYSDEPGAAGRRGSLGTVERGELAPPFADAAFELSVQQMSDVVETDRGFHLILRTE